MWELCSLIFRFLVQHKPSETHLAQITRSQEFIYSSCWWAYSRVPAHKTSNLVGQQHASFHWRFQHQPWSRVFIQKRYGQQHPERMRRWNKSYLHSLPCLHFCWCHVYPLFSFYSFFFALLPWLSGTPPWRSVSNTSFNMLHETALWHWDQTLEHPSTALNCDFHYCCSPLKHECMEYDYGTSGSLGKCHVKASSDGGGVV